MDITSKDQLLKKLLGVPLKTLSNSKRLEVLEYLLGNSDPSTLPSVTKYIHDNLEEIPLEIQEKVFEVLLGETLEEAKKDFYTYVKLMAPLVLPNDFVDGRHLKVICKELQDIAESIEAGGAMNTKRSMFFLAPGAMKTILCSVLFPSWVYGNHPNWHVIAVGYNDEFAMDKIGQPLRELMLSKEYMSLFPLTRLRADSRGKDRFVTTARGEFKSLGAKARAAGRRAHLLICDDTMSEKDAFSKAHRKEINDNYVAGLRSRLMRTPRGAEIIVTTRYHLDDLAGHLLDADRGTKRPWNIIKIPAILDKEASELLREPGDSPERFAPGTSFWPEMQPIEVLEEERETLMRTEPHKWYSLYMQNPVPQEGSIIKHEDWQWWDKADRGMPNVSHILVSMDTAFSVKKRADYSAFTVWGTFYPEGSEVPSLVLLWARKGKWEFPDLVEICEEIKDRWKPDFFVIEKQSSGQTLLQDLYRKGFPVVEYNPRGSKEERIHSASIWFRQGRVWVPTDSEWALDVVEEVCLFPSVKHDDLTDTVSQAILWYRDGGHIDTPLSSVEDEEAENMFKRTPKTYWKVLAS